MTTAPHSPVSARPEQVMSTRRQPARAPIVRLYALSVVANYVAQVPYALHLYGMAFSRSGAFLLAGTLVWFVVGYNLFLTGRRSGYWLMLAYALTQSFFYLNSEVLLSFEGYGLPYHLGHTQDPIVWLTFVIGDLNFLAALAMTVYLLSRRRTLLGVPLPTTPRQGPAATTDESRG